ncbi:hypothetical protein [Arthrobacter sp. M4]|uniref:hypothetical protein n=1 Tax=Arthrobacter sp. M4 TaxID=218160 RepID=UPI001CDC5C3D|nr:hypothetical protein [Arthrobacter sp. M4]MCA4133916.1 hypothetical protein [Arthrobacter sp. M4]
MDRTESHAKHPDRPTLEADPPYDYAEDEEVDEAWEERDDDILVGDAERIVPLDDDEKPAAGGAE